MNSLFPAPFANGPLFLADHGALDFLNTVALAEGQRHDFWQRDDDVKAWLAQSGLVALPDETPFEPGALLHEARELRETIRTLVARKRRARRSIRRRLIAIWLQPIVISNC